MQLSMGALWLAHAMPSEDAFDRLVTEFDVDDGQPCILMEGLVPNGVSITWDAWVKFGSSENDVFQLGIADARRYVPERMARAGIPGHLVEVDASTEEATATWRSTSGG